MKNPIPAKPRLTRIYVQCRDAAVKLREEGRDADAHRLERFGAQVDITVKSLATKGTDIYRLGAYKTAVALYKQMMGRYPEGSKYFHMNYVDGTEELREYPNG